MATETPRKFVQDEYTHQPHPDQRPDEHEQSDVKIRPLVIFIIFFAGVTAATLVGMRVLIAVFQNEAAKSPENQRKSLVASQPQRLPAGVPILQGVPGPADQPRFHGNTPAKDMAEFAALNKRILEQGDGKTGAMPIKMAMEAALTKDVYKADLQAARLGTSHSASAEQPAQSQSAPVRAEGGDGRK